MALRGEPGVMINACIHLPLMTFTCNNKYKHNTCTVLSACTSLQKSDSSDEHRIFSYIHFVIY